MTEINPSPLAAALAQAQGRIESASKDRKGNFGAYATLASVLDAIRAPMSEAGIAYVQLPTFDGELVHVETRLIHASGDWVGTTLSARPAKSDPQGIGSAITYLRRYGLMAVVGVAPDDDDGDASSAPQKPAPTRAAPPPVRAPSAKPGPSTTISAPQPPTGSASQPPVTEPAGTPSSASVLAGEGGEAAHDPSWEADRPRFCGSLRHLGTGYNEVKALVTMMGKPKPSAMSQERRDALLQWLGTDKGQAALLNCRERDDHDTTLTGPDEVLRADEGDR